MAANWRNLNVRVSVVPCFKAHDIVKEVVPAYRAVQVGGLAGSKLLYNLSFV